MQDVDFRRDQDLDHADHDRTYMAFARAAKMAAVAAPFFFAFVLYWTT